ncbi:MAG: SGNH/GDSL hydrolase family protein [Planctomycetota bacterium]|nr:SGNH/GDSL hydrolase family protein [Planctomycetota bacterium]
MLRIVRWGLVVISLCATTSVKAEDFFFRDGDVIVMIGDSITEQHLYSNYVEMWTVTRFPAWKLTFRNVGIGGDRSVGGNSRFSRDVLLHKPSAMTVDFGMNDGGYRAFGDDTFKPYMDGLQGMADQAQAANIRVAWVTPQPLDNAEQGPTALTGYNQTLEKFSEGVNAIAEKNNGLFVDQFHPYLAALDNARSKGPIYDRITAGDAVHPGPPGQALMAASILKGLHFPSLVSSAEINAAGSKVTEATNCTIENVEAKNGGITFLRLDSALPFFPADAMYILPHASILEELNDYRLKVTGLAAGMYEVKIDGTKVIQLTADELAAGHNIAAAALETGPIADQVKLVREAIERKNRFHHDSIFRGIVLTSVPGWIYKAVSQEKLEEVRKAAVAEELAKLPAMDSEIAQAVTMKSHVFEIVPMK